MSAALSAAHKAGAAKALALARLLRRQAELADLQAEMHEAMAVLAVGGTDEDPRLTRLARKAPGAKQRVADAEAALDRELAAFAAAAADGQALLH